MVQAEELVKGEKLRVDLAKVKDRLPSQVINLLSKASYGFWTGGYKIVDGGVGLVIELDDGTTCWFYEEELFSTNL